MQWYSFNLLESWIRLTVTHSRRRWLRQETSRAWDSSYQKLDRRPTFKAIRHGCRTLRSCSVRRPVRHGSIHDRGNEFEDALREHFPFGKFDSAILMNVDVLYPTIALVMHPSHRLYRCSPRKNTFRMCNCRNCLLCKSHMYMCSQPS